MATIIDISDDASILIEYAPIFTIEISETNSANILIESLVHSVTIDSLEIIIPPEYSGGSYKSYFMWFNNAAPS